METTREERQEVAARLKSLVPDVNGMRDLAAYLDFWTGVEGSDTSRLYRVADDRRAAKMTLEKLADLIDPTCSMDAIDTGEQADYECCEHIMHCKCCGAEFGYVLYSEDGDVSMDDKPKYCPCCGARVVSGDD